MTGAEAMAPEGRSRTTSSTPPRASDLADAVYGCIVGGAVGDALGAPVEGMDFHDIRAEHGGRLETFVPSLRGNTGADYGASRGVPGVPGAVTDDTTLRHYMCLAIIERGGRIDPDDFARIWIDKLNPARFWLNERFVLQKLQIGMNPWESGRGTPPAGCATMAIVPMGVVNAGDPEQAYRDAFLIASVNQDGLNRDAAATVAAGVAAALVPSASWEDVFAAMHANATDVVRRSLYLGERMAETSADVEAFADRFYAELLDWTWPAPPVGSPTARGDRGPTGSTWKPRHAFSGSSIEIMPALVGVLRLCGGDVNEAIVEGANFGRDCDTIGSLAGSIAGCLQGASAIRPEWVQECEAANRSFFQEAEGDPDRDFHSVSTRLVDVLRAQARGARERAQMLEQLVEDNGDARAREARQGEQVR